MVEDELKTRHFVDLHGKLLFLGTGEDYKLSLEPLTPTEVERIKQPLDVSKPWKTMWPILFRPDVPELLLHPTEPWRPLLEPLGIFDRVKHEIEESFDESYPFRNPGLSSESTPDDEAEVFKADYEESFNQFEWSEMEAGGLRVMAENGHDCHPLTSLRTYKTAVLIHAFMNRYVFRDGHSLWTYVSKDPVAGMTRRSEESPLFFKVFSVRVLKEVFAAISPGQELEVDEDDKMNGIEIATHTNVVVNLHGSDKRDLFIPESARELVRDKVTLARLARRLYSTTP